MITELDKLFSETLKMSPDLWLYVLMGIVGVAFLVSLIVGLAGGEFNKIKSLMSTVSRNPGVAVASMKQMPVSVKNRYRQARMAGVKPSDLVTESECVHTPYAHSLISKVWLVTLVATLICVIIGFCVSPLAAKGELIRLLASVGEEADEALLEKIAVAEANLLYAQYIPALMLAIEGGLFTLIGAIAGRASHSSAAKIYAKFSVVIDGGDAGRAAAAAAPQPAYTRPMDEPVHEQEPVHYAEPEQPVYTAEPQPEYVEPVQPQPAYEPPPVVTEPVVQHQPEANADAEAKRREREERIAAARAAQEAQIRAQQRPQPQPQPAPSQGNTSADDVIARIEQIDRDGAPRETMREVAQLLQKERAKPENKTPEQQKKLNEALSKLLKAMSAAGKR